MLPFVYTSVSDIAIVLVWYGIFCWYEYQILLFYWCDILPFVYTSVSDIAVVFVWYVTFCWYEYQILLLYWCVMIPFVYTCVSDIAVVLVWYGAFRWYMIIRFFSCIDVICYLLFILVYQILLCVGVICAIVDLSDILFGLILFESVYCCDILRCWFAYASIYHFYDMWYCYELIIMHTTLMLNICIVSKQSIDSLSHS